MELHVLASLDEVAADAWNGLAGSDCPFLRHEFLHTLERYRAVSEATGWIPHHLALYDGARLVAAAPAYLKTHSWGEFVFDFSWADAYARHGRSYYPKLVIAVPWTPATGPRMLTDPEGDPDRLRRTLAEAVRQFIERARLSSAHWLFPREADVASLSAAGYAIRHGCQYHWSNPGYRDFEDFLDALTSKKRKNIRRERRRVVEQGIGLRIIHGDEADDSIWSALHRFYENTFEQRGNVPVLSRECFRALGRRLGRRMVLVVAEQRGVPLAGAICFRDRERLYGRYWGCDREIDGLHFETCYYQGIEYCIGEGLKVFEPGAQGEHKVARGFLPTITRSAHYLRDARFREAIDDFLERERKVIDAHARQLTMEGPYRADSLQRLEAD
jgi:predicted N-acyltransferase